MKSLEEQESIPPMQKRQLNIYKPSDIKRWGVERFLSVVAPKKPIQPGFDFTEEEQRRMGDLLAEHKES